ncbi:MAG: sensor histidine kinase [Segniliparus sp.]|uniref:sensor histidine kinase n=1 Tax=Segniliparus sp. TaxID=2804064 RepID=UPI003F2DBC1D
MALNQLLRPGRLRRKPDASPPGEVVAIPDSSASLLAAVLAASPGGVVVVDEDEAVLVANPRSQELGVVQGGKLTALLAEAAAEAIARHRRESCAESQSVELVGKHLRFPAARGSKPEVVVKAKIVGASVGGEPCAILFVEDVTEAMRMETARRDFVANVSHELKTPVGGLSLLSEALMESADDPEAVRHFGKRMHAEANRLAMMVTELIALSRLQGAEKLPHVEVVKVDEVVHEAVDRLRLTAEALGIGITMDSPSGLEVMGDRALLVTALSNLLSNAVAYSPSGTSVSVSRRVQGGMAQLAVTDRGIGIAPEHQERVFERFFRVDKARSRATGGTGLGLAIVKHVMVNHGGSVRLWSKPGTGSTFTLELPASSRTPGAPPDPDSPKPTAHTSSTP